MDCASLESNNGTKSHGIGNCLPICTLESYFIGNHTTSSIAYPIQKKIVLKLAFMF